MRRLTVLSLPLRPAFPGCIVVFAGNSFVWNPVDKTGATTLSITTFRVTTLSRVTLSIKVNKMQDSV
jgi:hypothetical protein